MTAITYAINALVPARFQKAAKAIYALVLSILTVVALVAGAPVWVPVALLVLNAPLVYLADNVPDENTKADDEFLAEHGSQ